MENTEIERCKLVLADGTTFEIENGSVLGKMQIIFPDKASMVDAWDKFTGDNLKSVQITDPEGTLNAEYTDLVLDSVTSTEQEDGTILTTFVLRQKTEVELLKEQTAAQAEQMEMLTACVLEMSETVYA